MSEKKVRQNITSILWEKKNNNYKASCVKHGNRACYGLDKDKLKSETGVQKQTHKYIVSWLTAKAPIQFQEERKLSSTNDSRRTGCL